MFVSKKLPPSTCWKSLPCWDIVELLLLYRPEVAPLPSAPPPHFLVIAYNGVLEELSPQIPLLIRHLFCCVQQHDSVPHQAVLAPPPGRSWLWQTAAWGRCGGGGGGEAAAAVKMCLKQKNRLWIFSSLGGNFSLSTRMWQYSKEFVYCADRLTSAPYGLISALCLLITVDWQHSHWHWHVCHLSNTTPSATSLVATFKTEQRRRFLKKAKK